MLPGLPTPESLRKSLGIDFGLGDNSGQYEQRRQNFGNPQPLAETPEEDATLSEYSSPGSALQTIGNVLDTPGAFVRNILAGENPLPGIFDTSKRVYGKDLLKKAGILDEGDDSLGGTVAGIATDVLTDPLLWISGGATALGKSAAGEVAAKALGEHALTGVGGALVKRGAEGGLEQGWRVGAMKNTLNTVLDSLPSESRAEALSKMQTAAGSPEALDTLLAANEPLGAAARIHLPFMPRAGFNVGTGDWSQKLGGALDTAGEAIRYSPVGRTAAALFSAPNKGALSKEGQLAAQAAYPAEQDAISAAASRINPIIRGVDEAGMGTKEGGNTLNDVIEGLQTLPPDHPLQPAIGALKDELASMKDRANDVGLDFKEYDSPHTDYLPRQSAKGAFGEDSFLGGGGQRKLFPTGDNFQMARIPEFDVPGGKNMLNQMGTDPFIAGPAREAAQTDIESAPKVVAANKRYEEAVAAGADQGTLVNAKQGILNAKNLAVNDVAAEHIRSQYFHFDEDAYKAAETNLNDAQKSMDDLTKEAQARGVPPESIDPTVIDHFNEASQTFKGLDDTVQQANKLAGIFSGVNSKRVAEGLPIFENHPLNDVMARVKKFALSEQAAKNAYKFLGDFAEPTAQDLGSVPVRQVLESAGLKWNTPAIPAVQREMLAAAGHDVHDLQYTGALKNMADTISQRTGQAVTPDEVLDWHVPGTVAGDVKRTMGNFQAPEALKVVLDKADALTSWFKRWVTSPFPAFQARVKATGMMSDLVAGGITADRLLPIHQNALRLLRGETVPGAAEMPFLKAAGLTDEEATKHISDLIGSSGIYQGGQFPADIRGVKIGGALEAGTMGGLIPGMNPTSYSGALKSLAPDVLTGANPDAGLMSRLAVHPMQAGLQAANVSENSNRAATFLGLLEQGYDPASAASKTKIVNGDYVHGLSDFERSTMKRIIPFYSFLKLIVPNFVKDLIQNPGGITAETVRAENDMRRGSGFVPDQVGPGLAIPLGSSAPGMEKFLSESGINPIEHLNELIRPGHSVLSTLSKTGEAVLGQGNPLLKAPLELATGKQFYSNRDLADLYSRTGMPLADELIMNSPAARVLSTVGRMTDPRKSLPEKALNFLTSLQTTDVDVDKARRLAATQGIQEMMKGNPAVKSYTDIYVKPGDFASLSPHDQQAMQAYHLMNLQAQRAAKARKQTLAETNPLLQ